MANYLNLEMLGKRIKQARLKKDMTQFALAEEIGVSQNFLGDIERGIKAPSITTSIRLASVLGMSLDVLFAESINLETNETNDIYFTDKQLFVLKNIVRDVKNTFID